MVERWRPLPGYEGRYEISDQGRGKRLARVDALGRQKPEAIAKLTPDDNGYGRMSIDGTPRRMSVLVLLTWRGPRPPGHEACHRNGDPGDDRLDNLRWGTRSENSQDALAHDTNAMARRPLCKHGHDISDPANLYLRDLEVYGRRTCAICKDRANAEKNAARRAATARKRAVRL